MSNRDIRIMRLVDENNPSMGINITASYRMGGHNCFTGKMMTRGYAYDFSPTEKSSYGGELYRAFSGLNIVIEEAKRFSEKKLLSLANSLNLSDHIYIIKQIAENEGYNIDLSSIEQGA